MSEPIMDEEMRVEVILHDLLHKTLGASLAIVAARQRAAILSSDWLTEHDRQVAERAWDEGAEEAWNRSTPLVNGLHYQWRTAGEPLNPHRAANGEQK